jgi:hypothetical protein
MNENEPQAGDELELETMLREVRLARPSAGLDRRVENIFRPRWRMFIGPLSGFAAGILVTFGVFRYAPLAPAHPAPVYPSPVPISSKSPSHPPPAPALLIESRRVEALGNGEVNGLPVRLERSQSRLVVWRKTPTGIWRAELELPKQMIVRNADLN